MCPDPPFFNNVDCVNVLTLDGVSACCCVSRDCVLLLGVLFVELLESFGQSRLEGAPTDYYVASKNLVGAPSRRESTGRLI